MYAFYFVFDVFDILLYVTLLST